MDLSPVSARLRRLAWRTLAIALPAIVLAAALDRAAFAHHSFTATYFEDRTIKISGTVKQFQFRNPHGLIRVKTADKDGKEQVWKAETNSPSILERRGWSKDSLKAGDEVIIDGWPARDGTNYLRMRSVKKADGSPVGVPFEPAEEQR